MRTICESLAAVYDIENDQPNGTKYNVKTSRWRNRLRYHGAPVPGKFVDRSLFVFAYNHANNFRKAKL